VNGGTNAQVINQRMRICNLFSFEAKNGKGARLEKQLCDIWFDIILNKKVPEFFALVTR
jgi:hypothetical protein